MMGPSEAEKEVPFFLDLLCPSVLILLWSSEDDAGEFF